MEDSSKKGIFLFLLVVLVYWVHFTQGACYPPRYGIQTRSTRQRYTTGCGFWGWGRCSRYRYVTTYQCVFLAVDGGWGAWSHWSACGSFCGQSTRLRLRSCNNPHKQNGGRDCVGSNVQKESCDEGFCSGSPCPSGFTKISENWCLYISGKNVLKTYSDANTFCTSLSKHARLVTIKHKAEQDIIVKKLPAHADCWIGLDDRTTEGQFVFSDGTKLGQGSFTHWEEGSPSKSTLADCVFIDGKGAGYMWRDTRCEERKMFSCEIRAKMISTSLIG
ncbi:tetranectin-like protein [Lingula anatina]|nr:tetranectin-like protein [Lingula anatina]|eukprot:XP_013406091.1 tetranectin-like protein [Lingula anatina]